MYSYSYLNECGVEIFIYELGYNFGLNYVYE